MTRRGLFVTGTDTGVGKTLVGCAVLRGLRARGLDVGALKPVETGVGPDGPADALALAAASGAADPPEDVCPQAFALPAAPSAAARHESRRVDLTAIDAALTRQMTRHDWVLVEGAGGLLVPVAEGVDMAELARRCGLPVLVVARGALGTLNHTRLTLEALRARGLEPAGLVISHGPRPLSEADLANLEELRREPGAPLLGEIPPLGPGAAAEEHLALDRLSL